MKIAWRYTKDIDHAQDVVQDAFVRIFHALDSFDESKAPFVTWMKTICIREAIFFLRKHKSSIGPMNFRKICSVLMKN